MISEPTQRKFWHQVFTKIPRSFHITLRISSPILTEPRDRIRTIKNPNFKKTDHLEMMIGSKEEQWKLETNRRNERSIHRIEEASQADSLFDFAENLKFVTLGKRWRLETSGSEVTRTS